MLFQKMSRLCFNKCVTKPGATLDSTEQVNIFNYILIKVQFENTVLFYQKCVSMCMDRYMETVTLVSKSFGERLMAEAQNMN